MFTLHEYAHDPRHGSSYGMEASEALSIPPERVFKTLIASVDSSLAVGVVPVHRQLDLKALAAATGGKRAVMADVSAAERATGYVTGGISPLGQRRRLPVVIDQSALEHETVFCGGGRSRRIRHRRRAHRADLRHRRSAGLAGHGRPAQPCR